jgi:hypothetical protein
VAEEQQIPAPAGASASRSLDELRTPAEFQKHAKSLPSYAGEVDQSDAKTLEEFTDPYSRGRTTLRFAERELKGWITALTERRILVIHCQSQKVIQNVVHELMDSVHFRDVTTLALRKDCGKQSSSFTHCLQRSAANKETLVLVEATDISKQPFMDDLFADSALSWSSHAQTLERQKRRVLVLTTTEHLARYRPGMIPVVEIPVEFALISETESDDSRVAQLAEEFTSRSAKGEFGPSRAAQAACLEKYLADGNFLQIMAGRGAPPSLEPSVVLGDDPLADTVQFVAAFFPKVAVADFQELVLCIVGDDTDPLTPSALPPQVVKMENGSTALETQRPRLAERFRTSNHRLLKELGLYVTTESSLVAQFQSVAFRDERQRGQVVDKFASEHHFFFLEAFEKLRESGVLFHESDAVVNAFVRLAAAQMVRNPHRYGVQWLLDLLLAAGERIDVVHVEVNDADERARAEALMTLLDAHQARHRRIFEQLEILLRAMLDHPGLRGTIQDTCARLCSMGAHGAVLELARRLERAPDLDVLSWLRRVLDEGDETSRERAVTQLESLGCRPSAVSGGDDLAHGAGRVLLQLGNWAKEGASGRPSRQLALEVVARIGEHALGTSPLLDERMRSRRSPGLLEWVRLPSASKAQIGEFVEWLVSPQCEEFFEEEPRRSELSRAVFIRWYAHPYLLEWLPDEGGSLVLELVEVWHDALSRTARESDRPTAALFQTVVFADCAQRLEGDAAGPGMAALKSAVDRHANARQVRAWRTLLHAHVASTQKIRRALQRAETQLSRQQREQTVRIRARAQQLDVLWRGFSESLSQPAA